MARNKLLSLKLDIPNNPQFKEGIRRYTAQHLQRHVQQTRPSGRQEGESIEQDPSSVSDGKVVESSPAAIPPEPCPGLGFEEQLCASKVQLARLNQRYNMVASRLQGATRRKLLLRDIQRERARIESLEQQIR